MDSTFFSRKKEEPNANMGGGIGWVEGVVDHESRSWAHVKLSLIFEDTRDTRRESVVSDFRHIVLLPMFCTACAFRLLAGHGHGPASRTALRSAGLSGRIFS